MGERGFMPRELAEIGGSSGSVPVVVPEPEASTPTPSRSLFLTYILVQFVLWLLVFALPHPARGYASTTAGALGILTLVIGVAWRKPTRLIGWWLVAASSLALLAAGTVTALRYGLEAVVADAPLVPLTLVAASLLLLAAGLAVLGQRRNSTAGLSDLLDTTIVTAAAALLVWTFTSDIADPPALEPRFIVLVVLPLGAVLVFATAIKLVFSAGLHILAITLLVLAALASVAASMDVVVPTTDGFELINGRTTKLLWTGNGTLLGAAALHRSFGNAARGVSLAGSALSPWRVAIFAVTAVMVPLALAIGLTNTAVSFAHSAVGIAIPTAAAAALLLALVGRLALVARLSERRATELDQRSSALTEAMDHQEALQQELAYQATHDPLTGLSNRLVLAERLRAMLARDADAACGALLLLDLDGFKDINDTYGHPVGDVLLAQVAERLHTVVPDDALLARLGGDEFAVLMDVAGPRTLDGPKTLDAPAAVPHSPQLDVHSPQPDARAVAAALLEAVAQPIGVDDLHLHLSASIGLLAVEPAEDRLTPSEALRDADLALYAAKHRGKNQVVTFEARLRNERPLDRPASPRLRSSH